MTNKTGPVMPTNNTPELSPEENIARLMNALPQMPDMGSPENDPLKEAYTPKDMEDIIRVMIEGGYKDVKAANKALRIMFTQSDDMLNNFESMHGVINGVQDASSKIQREADKYKTESQTVSLAMKELSSLILAGNTPGEDLVAAANRCVQIAEAATKDVGEYDGNMLNVAVNLRALADKNGPLRGLGSASRERVLYLTDVAAAILDDARINMLSLKDAAQSLVNETVHLRSQLETANAVADKPAVVN